MVDVKINDLSPVVSVTDTMQIETDISGATANKVTAQQIKTYVLNGLDHGVDLVGLGDDDHTIYSLADGTRYTTTQTPSRVLVSDSSGYLVTSSTTTTQLSYLDATSSIQTQLNTKYDSDGDIDHGGINGLGGDDHTQYALADGTRWTTTNTANRVPISDASGNLVVSVITDTELGYLDGVTSNIQTQLNSKYDTDTDVDHDSTTNFVANEHIDHTSVSISAGTGLSGGGDISSNRTISLDINGLSADASPVGSTDYVVTYDASGTTHKKVLLDNLPGGGGGSSTFTGLTDTPSSYSSQASKLVAVNTGETALEFIDAPSGVTSGSTLPSSPTTGQLHLHTPTGRKWLMGYDGTSWSPIVAYGETTIYMDDSVNGSTDWDDGYSSGTAWDITEFIPKLPPSRTGKIDIYLASRSFNSGDSIIIPKGLAGAGTINIIGNTTSRGTTTHSSSSSPHQSMTMTSTVPAGTTEGDILLYSSGTQPDLGAFFYTNQKTDCWVVLSGSGTNLQIAGGMMSLNAPSSTVFDVRYRNSSFSISDDTQLVVESKGVEFRYVEFNSSHDWAMKVSEQVSFVGCKFNITGARIRECNDVIFQSCYLQRTDNTQRGIIWCIGSLPKLICRCLLKSTSTSSVASAEVFSVTGWGGNSAVIMSGSRCWHTQSGARIGRVDQGTRAFLRAYIGSFENNYFVVGGGSNDLLDVSNISYVNTFSNVTASGTSGSLLNVDSSTYGVGS